MDRLDRKTASNLAPPTPPPPPEYEKEVEKIGLFLGLLRYQTDHEPAVFVPEVAKQHDVFVPAIASKVLVSARASFW